MFWNFKHMTEGDNLNNILFMEKYSYIIKWCPNCFQGWIEIVKIKGTEKLLLCCSECETLWKEPECIQSNNGFQNMELQVEVPTEADIEIRGWKSFILKD
jgi:hypothetical protein